MVTESSFRDQGLLVMQLFMPSVCRERHCTCRRNGFCSSTCTKFANIEVSIDSAMATAGLPVDNCY